MPLVDVAPEVVDGSRELVDGSEVELDGSEELVVAVELDSGGSLEVVRDVEVLDSPLVVVEGASVVVSPDDDVDSGGALEEVPSDEVDVGSDLDVLDDSLVLSDVSLVGRGVDIDVGISVDGNRLVRGSESEPVSRVDPSLIGASSVVAREVVSAAVLVSVGDDSPVVVAGLVSVSDVASVAGEDMSVV